MKTPQFRLTKENYTSVINDFEDKKTRLASYKEDIDSVPQTEAANSGHHSAPGRDAHKQLVLMQKCANLNAALINNDPKAWRSYQVVSAAKLKHPSNRLVYQEALVDTTKRVAAHARIGDDFAEIADHPQANKRNVRAAAVHQYAKGVYFMLDVANATVKDFNALFQDISGKNKQEKLEVQRRTQELASSFDDLQNSITLFAVEEVAEKFALFPELVESNMNYFAAIPLFVTHGATNVGDKKNIFLRETRDALVKDLKVVAGEFGHLSKTLSINMSRPGSSVSLGHKSEANFTAIDEVDDLPKIKPQPLVRNQPPARGAPMEVINAARYLSFEEFEDRFKSEAQTLIKSQRSGGVTHGNY